MNTKELDELERWTRILLKRVAEENKKDDGAGKYPIIFELPFAKLSALLNIKIY